MTDTAIRPMTEAELVAAQRRSMNNRGLIDGQCGCFHCLSTFPASQVAEWIDGGQTAICPVCGIDAVLSKGTDSVSADMLEQMHRWWFETPVERPAVDHAQRMA